MSLQDFRQAIRSLRLAPGFTLAAVGSIALGIAGNVTVFSLVNAILIKPLPYPEHERLVTIKGVTSAWGPGSSNPTLNNFHLVPGYTMMRWRKEVESIESIEAVNTGLVKNMENLDGPGEPERVGAIRVTAGLWICSGSSRNWAAGLTQLKNSMARLTSSSSAIPSGGAISPPTRIF